MSIKTLRLTLRQKITMTSLALMMALAVVLVTALSTTQRSSLIENAQEMQRITLRVLAQNIAGDLPGFRHDIARDGTVTQVVWDQIPDFDSHDLVDTVGGQTGKTATIFRLDTASGEFVRMTTNVVRPDGTRAVGTVLDPTGPVHSAMMRGNTYDGQANILGLDYLTVYVPIHDSAGQVHGVLYAGVSIDGIEQTLWDNQVLATAITAGLLAMAFLFNLVMTRRALRPLVAIDAAMQDVAARRYDRDIPATGMGDEIGSIARNLEGFRDQLRSASEERRAANALRETAAAQADAQMQMQVRVVNDISSGLERLSRGDLTSRIESPPHDPFPQNYEALRGTFNDVVDNLAITMARIVDVAQQVRGGSEEITSAAQDLAGRAETQAATLEESAAALNELTASVQSTAELARTAENTSIENRALAETGQTDVGAVVQAMERIEKSSEQISRIIALIEDIAFQTNLLALNAGVEAARAGDAGRGFAVVASEVRGLAQRASDSARDIKELIVDASQHVKTGSALVARTGSGLSQILQKARVTSEQIAAITVAAVDQSVALSEINTGVNQLDQVTQQNAAVAEETNAAAFSLQQQASLLSKELANFTLDPAVGGMANRPAPARHQPPAHTPRRDLRAAGGRASPVLEF